MGIIRIFGGDAYQMDAIDSIGLPATVDEDDANGLKVNGGDSGWHASDCSCRQCHAPCTLTSLV